MELFPIIILIFISVCCAAYILIYSFVSGERLAEKRLKALSGPKKHNVSNVEQAKRNNVANTLKELEARQKSNNKLTIDMRLSYAGLRWSKMTFFLASFASAIACALILLIISQKPVLAIGGLLIGGGGLPRLLLSYLGRRRVNRFIDDLPATMDIIVRGVRVGLPISDCLRTVVSEMSGPIQIEFRGVMEALTLGVPLKEAVFRLPERVPVPEANFIAIVVSLQQSAGGNLSTALANLASILRERKKLRGKIAAVSMEAKASAAIIGSLPVIVALLVHLTTPKYLTPLWNTQTGSYALIASMIWMGAGIAIMKKMINFKI